MPLGVRRTAFATLGTSLIALAAAGVAYAGNGGFLPGRGALAERAPDPRRLHLRRDLHRHHLLDRRGRAGRVHHQVPPRASARAPPKGRRSTARRRLEIIWTVAPVVILAAIGAFVFCKLPGIADAPKAAAADETTIQVEGHQFYWLFRYPNGAVSIDRMVAPADQVVNERIVGLDFDVNHSWWVPDLGGKYDAIPGKMNKTWFKAPAGDYVARCAELCGVQHALMDGVVHVVPRAAVRRVHLAARSRTRAGANARPGGVAGRLPDVPPARPRLHRPGARRQPAARATARARDAPAQRAGADAGRRQELDRRADRGARRLHEAVRATGAAADGRERRDDSALSRRLAPRHGHVVADDGRPQADRDPVHLDVARLLRASAACWRS